MATNTPNKHARTISLTNDMNERLLALCEHLGTNPNSYMINEIGKAVSRDEITFKAKTNQDDMMKLIMGMVESSGDSE